MKSLKAKLTDIWYSILGKGFMIFSQVMIKVQPIWDAHKILICISTGVILGLIIGLIMGYGLFPARWSNLTPGHLRGDFRTQYLVKVAESFRITGDVNQARQALGLDSKIKTDVPWLKDKALLEKDIQYAIDNAADPRIALTNEQVVALGYLKNNLGEIQKAPATEEQPKGISLGQILAIVMVLLLVGLAVLAVWYLLIKPRQGAEPEMDLDAYEPITVAEPVSGEPGAPGVGIAEPPVKSFTTTYMIGDDYFDPSFSIEIGPDFLGECGIGISETIGAGDPKKVTAFEAWLFDKSDIRTLTIVLASEYAASEPDLRAKLEPKGEVEIISPGKTVILETTVLRVQVQIKELEYVQGGNIPNHSCAQKITFVLQAWVKAGSDMAA
ncbi:MAG: hypothetical protein JXA21_16370 [Anaerolineae bacterium]|nr:hypothetical protein [Anaerolineae bacterium]